MFELGYVLESPIRYKRHYKQMLVYGNCGFENFDTNIAQRIHLPSVLTYLTSGGLFS